MRGGRSGDEIGGEVGEGGRKASASCLPPERGGKGNGILGGVDSGVSV